MNDAENGGWGFLIFAAAQTLLVGLLAGVLGRIVPYSFRASDSFTYFDLGASDFAAVLAVGTGDAVWALVVVLPFVVPWFVVANAELADRRRAALMGVAALLVLLLVSAPDLSDFGVPPGMTGASVMAFGLFSLMTASGFAVATVLGGLCAVFTLGARGEESLPVAAAPLGIGLSILLLAGLAVGAPVGADVDDATFVLGGSDHSPDGTFTYHYERTDDGRAVLTIHHRGGASIPVDELYVEGDSVVEVDGADQTEAGRWQGSTVPGADGPTVDAGNAVAVGVTGGCEVRVVRRDESDAATIGKYECPGA